MKAYTDICSTAGSRLRCNVCKKDRCVRADSVLASTKKTSLRVACLILVLNAIEERLSIAASSRLSGKHKTGQDRMGIEKEEVNLREHYGPSLDCRYGVHSNTIEGLWAHLRSHIRGVPR